MGKGRDKEEDSETFDAVRAAQELDEALHHDMPAKPDEYIRTLESEIEGLNNLLHQKEALLLRADTRAQESLEEIERIKKRLLIEANQRVEKRVAEVISEILDVGDDLGRAIRAAHDMDHNPAVVEGIELVRQSFGKRLAKLGVTRILALGTPFDPAIHEAVSAMPVQDPAQNGMVLAIAREGYAHNGKVLREARVVVGKLG